MHGFPHGRRCQGCGARLARDNQDLTCAPCGRRAGQAARRPPQVPPGFWDAEPLRAALASRHMGRVIRAWRRHPYHGPRGISQETVAGWLGITQAQLSRIETGPPVVHLDRLAHWARVLGIPPSTSGSPSQAARTGSPSRQTATASAATWNGAPC